MPQGALTVLVVDDELPALSELRYLLEQDDRIGEIHTATSGTLALGALNAHDIDVVFSDISMPGLDGMELARVVAKFSERPQIVFVTAHDRHAVDAFALEATDYVMKPVRPDRLSEAVRRVVAHRAEQSPAGMPREGAEPTSSGPERPGSPGAEPSPAAGSAGGPGPEPAPDETIPVELGGVTRFIQRSQIRYAQAHGDYARLHTATGSHLVRIPLSTLEEQWGEHGFVRIHRSTLVALPHVTEVHMDRGRCTVLVGDVELQVSRRHTKHLRGLLLRRPVADRRARPPAGE
jgi:DNA-binding LytR/AlgR family response regulator